MGASGPCPSVLEGAAHHTQRLGLISGENAALDQRDVDIGQDSAALPAAPLPAFEDVHADAGGDATPFVDPAGVLDPSFGSGGVTIVPPGMFAAQPYAVVERAGGGYVAVGVHRGAAMDSHFGLFAFTPSGMVDTAFATNGIADVGPTTNDYGYGAIRLPDGRTVSIRCGPARAGGLFGRLEHARRIRWRQRSYGTRGCPGLASVRFSGREVAPVERQG